MGSERLFGKKDRLIEEPVIGNGFAIEMSIHLIDLTGNTDVATVDAFDLLTKIQPSVEIRSVKIENATA